MEYMMVVHVVREMSGRTHFGAWQDHYPDKVEKDIFLFGVEACEDESGNPQFRLVVRERRASVVRVV